MVSRRFLERRSARERRALWFAFATLSAWVVFRAVVDGTMLTVACLAPGASALVVAVLLAADHAGGRTHARAD